MLDYTKLRDELAVPKITEYGKAISICRPGSNVLYTKSYDYAQSRWKWTLIAEPHTVVYTDPATSPVDLPGYAIETRYEQNEIDGTVVQANDRRFKVVGFTDLTTSDKLIIGSTILNIINVRPYQPGSVILLYELQCRA